MENLRAFLRWLGNSLAVQLLYNPFHAFDLTDESGRTDHGKVLPAILLASAIVAQFRGKQYDAIVLVILGSLAYGYGAWRTFLKTRSVTHATTVTVNETIERRIVEDAVDPTND